MTLDEDQNIFLVTSVKVCKNQQIIRKHAMKLTLITFKDEREWTCNNIRKPLLTLCLFDCCVSSVKKYCLGALKCHDHDIFTLQQPIRLQHFEQGNEKYVWTHTIWWWHRRAGQPCWWWQRFWGGRCRSLNIDSSLCLDRFW